MSPAELLLVWRLFRVDAARNRKRIGLTVMAIAWGTLSIVLLLSFGEGMKRSFHRNSRGMGEGIGVLGCVRRVRASLPCDAAADRAKLSQREGALNGVIGRTDAPPERGLETGVVIIGGLVDRRRAAVL